MSSKLRIKENPSSNRYRAFITNERIKELKGKYKKSKHKAGDDETSTDEATDETESSSSSSTPTSSESTTTVVSNTSTESTRTTAAELENASDSNDDGNLTDAMNPSKSGNLTAYMYRDHLSKLIEADTAGSYPSMFTDEERYCLKCKTFPTFAKDALLLQKLAHLDHCKAEELLYDMLNSSKPCKIGEDMLKQERDQIKLRQSIMLCDYDKTKQDLAEQINETLRRRMQDSDKRRANLYLYAVLDLNKRSNFKVTPKEVQMMLNVHKANKRLPISLTAADRARPLPQRWPFKKHSMKSSKSKDRKSTGSRKSKKREETKKSALPKTRNVSLNTEPFNKQQQLSAEEKKTVQNKVSQTNIETQAEEIVKLPPSDYDFDDVINVPANVEHSLKSISKNITDRLIKLSNRKVKK